MKGYVQWNPVYDWEEFALSRARTQDHYISRPALNPLSYQGSSLKWNSLLLDAVMCLKEANGMTNSVDPDQTAPSGAVRSGSALFLRLVCPNIYNFYGNP